MKSILSRIGEIAKNEKITIGALEKKIGASKGVLSRAIVKETDIQSKWIRIMVDNYPQYSTEWLLTGKGSMLKEFNKGINVLSESNLMYKYRQDGIPLIPIDAMAGFGTGEQQIFEYECEHYVVPVFKEAEFLIPVKGSSMYPKYNSGDIVACKKLPLDDLFFQWNKVYVLDTPQGALIKRVKKGSDNNHILIVSDNPNYEPFELHKNKLYAVAIVVGVIRLE